MGVELVRRVGNDIMYFELNPNKGRDVMLTGDLLLGEV